MNTISSRTPEGEPNRCPLCGAEIRIEFSAPMGDAPCPHCGQLLWFLQTGNETRYIERELGEPLIERLIRFFSEQWGVPQAKLREMVVAGDYSFLTETGADSLDLVELVMELEEGAIEDR